jgi:hypothetical protein
VRNCPWPFSAIGSDPNAALAAFSRTENLGEKAAYEKVAFVRLRDLTLIRVRREAL